MIFIPKLRALVTRANLLIWLKRRRNNATFRATVTGADAFWGLACFYQDIIELLRKRWGMK